MATELTYRDVFWKWIKKGFPREEAIFQADNWEQQKIRKETTDRAAETKRMRDALRRIAIQKKTNELVTEYDIENADFNHGYDTCIDVARAALKEKE